MRNILVASGQSLLDVSVKGTGTVENIFRIIQANGDYSITDILVSGSALTVDDSDDLINKSNLDYFDTRDISPATTKSLLPDAPTGIGNEFIESPNPVFTIE